MRHVVKCTHISVQQTPVCAPLSQQREKKLWTNQGHLRTACQLLFLLAALSSMCAVEAHISTTSSSSGTQGISNYVLAAKICTVTTARPSPLFLSFLNNRGFTQSLEKLNPLWSFSATTWRQNKNQPPFPPPSKKKKQQPWSAVLMRELWGTDSEWDARFAITCSSEMNLKRQLDCWYFTPELSMIHLEKFQMESFEIS